MKKLVSVLLAMVMSVASVVGLSACGEEDNVLTCGVTIFENMNEYENGDWTGFESDFAKEVGKILDMEVKFQEITWSQKYNELNSGAIDCIWNGFTANSSDDGIKRSELVDFSYGYMRNRQCVVVKQENLATYKTAADLAGKTACVEGGSAGEEYAKTLTDAAKIKLADAQKNAFTEVWSGAVDFIVVDRILARGLCGKGDFANLVVIEDIAPAEEEIYAIGFKKGSKLTAKVNDAIQQLYDNGKLLEIAEKYGFEKDIQITEKID